MKRAPWLIHLALFSLLLGIAACGDDEEPADVAVDIPTDVVEDPDVTPDLQPDPDLAPDPQIEPDITVDPDITPDQPDETPPLASVIITEIMIEPCAVGTSDGQWFEIHNLGSAAVDLTGWTIKDADTDSHVIADTLSIPAGASFVFGVNGTAALNGGVDVDYIYEDLVFELIDELYLVDTLDRDIDSVIYELVDWPVVECAAISLDPAAYTASDNDDLSNWCWASEAYGDGDLGTPGQVNPPCLDDTVDWCRLDRPLTVTGQPGDLFEIYGHVYVENLTDRTTATDPYAGLVAEVGFGPDGSDPATNASWVWAEATPSTAWVDTDETDNDEYLGLMLAPIEGTYDYAYRFQLNGSAFLLCDADTGTDGEDGSEDGYDTANAGSMTIEDPCFPNPCDPDPDPSCDGTEIVTYQAGVCSIVERLPVCTYAEAGRTDCDDDGQFCSDGVCTDWKYPEPGDLLISEVMTNPTKVSAADGAWFELANLTSAEVNLHGLSFADAGSDAFMVGTDTFLGGRSFFVFGANGTIGLNGGVAVDFVYEGFTLGTGSDSIVMSVGETMLDTVAWDDGATFPDVAGASMQLSFEYFTTSANDLGTNWCTATTPYGLGDYGTPGVANPHCDAGAAQFPIGRCRLQAPDQFAVAASGTADVTGRLFIEWLTDRNIIWLTNPDGNANDPVPGVVLGELGWGANGSTSSTAGWTWFTAEPDNTWSGSAVDEPAFDQYIATLVATDAVGTFDFAFRFSGNGGTSWEYCDLATGTPGQDGSENGYQPANAGQLTVVECLVKEDCEGGWVCNPATYTCVECLGDADCPGYPFQVCSANACSSGCAEDRFEPNDISTAAEALTGSSWEDDLWICPGDEDWFSFSLAPGSTAITTISIAFTPGGTGDLGLYLFNATGTPIGTGIGTDDGQNIRFVFSEYTLDGTDFLFQIKGIGDDHNEYALSFLPSGLWCRLQYPESIRSAGGEEETVYGRLWISGLTDENKEGNDPLPDFVYAQVGYGTVGDYPEDDPLSWAWFDAEPNSDYSTSSPSFEANNDEYQADILVPTAIGTYDYAYRFTGDGGVSWLYCDLDTGETGEDGSQDGYDPVNAGKLVVEECIRDANCGGGEPFCDPDTWTCVECYQDDHCPAYPFEVCSTNACGSGCAEDRFEPNDSSGAAEALTGSSWEDDLWICQGDEDWFSFQLTAGTTAIMSIAFTPGGTGDLGLELVNATGTSFGDHTSNDNGESIQFVPTTNGTYYLQVTGEGADYNIYDLSILPSGLWCRLQAPKTIETAFEREETVYGRLWISGLTDQNKTGNDPLPNFVFAEVGYGTAGSNPDDASPWPWVWFEAGTNPGYGTGSPDFVANDDEYRGYLTAPSVIGTYDYAYRFTGDAGVTWLYCDTLVDTSNGSADGYQPDNAGKMTVVGCSSDDDCIGAAGGEYCDMDSSTCVECTEDSHCQAGEGCHLSQCVVVGEPLPFSQDWTDTSMITNDDDWSGVPGIVGYLGNYTSSQPTNVDPQTLLDDYSDTDIDVIANKTIPDTLTSGGVAEFHLANPVVAFQGSQTADAPFLLIHIDTRDFTDINVAYNLRDIDGSDNDAVQQVALHYRVGDSGVFTNIPAGYKDDASTGPDLAVLVTPINVTLPAEVNNQPMVQIRVMTTNALYSDEWIGVDDIVITGTPL
ncbi:MAG: lamin tail domain-containing protein [Bradymonadales bacterium]|nr:lamin tail domain-containing protein [Bradymonadales bacterium]